MNSEISFEAPRQLYEDRFVHSVVVTNSPLGTESRFGIAIFEEGDYRLVVLSELPDNRGKSVTNMIELLVERIPRDNLLLRGIPQHKIFFVEHYSEDYQAKARGHNQLKHDFQLVELDGNTGAPRWTAVETIIKNHPNTALRQLLKEHLF